MSAENFRDAARHLVTSVALVTSQGKNGPNVMAAEWTFQVSYRPMRLIVLVAHGDATHDNILENREFGANFASDDQATLASLAGAYTGKEVNKLSSELFQTYPAKRIRPPMISGCFLNAECKLSQVIDAGDHTMFLGEVVEVQFDGAKTPLLSSQRRYWQRGPSIQKKPSIYTTYTLSPESLRLDGRLQGVEKHPQTIAVTVRSNSGGTLLKEMVETDEYGYFQLSKPNTFKEKGVQIAIVEWEKLRGTASLAQGT
jgi:flavin reductase (DIM6/NTAB) family NADH-FMN oxidoreductase RutF